MPLLQFICVKCEKLLEFQVPLNKFGTKIRCPHCKRIVKQILFPVSFRIN